MDMWAFGVTLYMWIYGELPFNGAAPFMIYESIRRGEVRLPPLPLLGCFKLSRSKHAAPIPPWPNEWLAVPV